MSDPIREGPTRGNMNQAPVGPKPAAPAPQFPSNKSQNNVTVRREIDRLARQMGRMTEELRRLKEAV